MSRLPSPLIAGTQWRHGEPINDNVLHTRIDEPLETLGGFARTFNQDLPGFYGYLPSGYSGAANAEVLWTEGYDTDACYNPATGQYTCLSGGIYVVATNIATTATTPTACSISRNGLTDPRVPWSPEGPAVTNGGPRIGAVLDLSAGDILSVRVVQAFTTSTVGINWWFVQMLTWA